MRADTIFNEQLEDILYHSEGDDTGEKVRPKWSDGIPAHTQYITHSSETWLPTWGVPIQTGRKIAWKSGLREILAIYQKRATTRQEFEDMGIFWWEPWFNGHGNLGTSYAYQLNKQIEFSEGTFNQMDRVIYLLKNDPFNRGIITNMFNLEELKDMALRPCAFMTMWSVSGDKLNLMLIQRSGDLLPAAGFGGINTTQYYFLLAMIAQVTGYKIGKFTHIVNNLHVYDRHKNFAKLLLNANTFESPKLWINPEITDFYDFTANDIKLVNYEWDLDLKGIPIAE